MSFTKRSKRFVKSVSSLSKFLLLDLKYKLDNYKITKSQFFVKKTFLPYDESGWLECYEIVQLMIIDYVYKQQSEYSNWFGR